MNDNLNLISIDDIKYMAKGIYGSLPKSCSFVQKTITLTYPSANSFGDMKVLENPIFVTNVQISTNVNAEDNGIYVSASANDTGDVTAFEVGKDGDVDMGGGTIWKYIKVSGDATNGATIEITLNGYELGYSDSEEPSSETFLRTARITITSAQEDSGVILVDDNVTLSLQSLVFQNGILVPNAYYTINNNGGATQSGYITFDADFIHEGDLIVVTY